MAEKLQHCRFYENAFPEVDDLVMVNVRQIAEMGAYVELLEYNNIEGMILLSELSRRRIRSIQRLIRVGRNEVVVVLRVDKEKGYIDLSKRRVSAEDVIKCEDKFNKSKAVHRILRMVADKTNTELKDLYQTVGWPLYKKFPHAIDALRLAITEPEKAFADLEIPEHILKELQETVSKQLTPQPVKLRADLELTCFGPEGIDGIIKALKAGEALSRKNPDGEKFDIEIKIKLVASPLYVMSSQAFQKEEGIEVMEQALAVMESVIKECGGDITVKVKPRAVSEVEEKQLAALMLQAEQEATEVPGDDDEEEDE